MSTYSILGRGYSTLITSKLDRSYKCYGNMYVTAEGEVNADIVKGSGKIHTNGASILDQPYASQYLIGGKANETIVYSYGRQYILEGGSATNVSLRGGEQYVSNGTASKTTIYAKGKQIIEMDGMASNTTIQSQGKSIVHSGGTMSSVTINKGGELILQPGAQVSSVTISSGAKLNINGMVNIDGVNNILQGAVINNTKSPAFALLNNNTTFNFSKNNNLKGIYFVTDTAKINFSNIGNNIYKINDTSRTVYNFDISAINQTKNYFLTFQSKSTLEGKITINVSSSQKIGTYKILNKVNIDNQKIDIKDKKSSLGTFTANSSSFIKNGIKYTLTSKNNYLNLTVSIVKGKIITSNLNSQKSRSYTPQKGQTILNGTQNSDIFYNTNKNDKIICGGGRDVVVYDKNKWGRDTIDAQIKGGTVTILFNGLSAKDITTKKSGAKMVITQKNASGQSITVNNWNNSTHNIVYGGTLNKFNKYISAATPTAAQTSAASNEVWKKAGLLA